MAIKCFDPIHMHICMYRRATLVVKSLSPLKIEKKENIIIHLYPGNNVKVK